jgi:Helicase associated domain
VGWPRADLRKRLQKLPGWQWTPRDSRWYEGFRRLQKYIEENGHACPPQSYVTADGYRLGMWVATQRVNNAKKSLEPDLKDRLEKLPGWEWSPLDPLWEEGFRRLQMYIKNNGHACPPRSYTDDDGYQLGTWVTQQRQRNTKGLLSHNRHGRLSKLRGWEWKPRRGGAARRG